MKKAAFTNFPIKNIASSFWFEFRLFLKECFLPAVLILLVIEGLSRQSLVKPFIFMFTRPHLFLYNAILVSIPLSLCLFFRRRRFALFFLSSLWLTIGIVDFVLLQFRTTPFTAIDLLLLDSAFSIMKHYMSVPQIILVVVLVVLVLLLGVFLFKKARKVAGKLQKSIAGLLFFLLVIFGILVTRIFLFTGLLERNFGNLANSFHTNGLPFCFYASIFGTGISKPATYSDEEIDRILKALMTPTPSPEKPTPPENTPTLSPVTPTISPEPSNSPTLSPNTPTAIPAFPTDAPLTPVLPEATPTENPLLTGTPEAPTDIPKGPSPEPTGTPVTKETEHPNFIFLQLESFFDLNRIEGTRFSKNPIPNFDRIRSECPSGLLSVPSIGAGTANTEFEILTGMNLDFFGPGEYPYKTVLKDTTCESIAYNLSAVGLSTHAIHNNDGTFYERHKVFSQLGFDTFTPIEYMGTYEMTPLGWPKDTMLTTEIMKSLRSTESQDLVYTISVQGHGAYPTKILVEEPEIVIRELPDDLKDSYYGLQYYVNQLYEMDQFLGELMDTLSRFEEETVLVVYGDHLPSFPFTEEMMLDGTLFDSEYVIWNNRTSQTPERIDLEAFELTAHVLSQYQIHEGIFTRFHQTQSDSKTYLSDLEMLEYDVLYGPLSCYDGIQPYTASKLHFGIDPIELTNVFLKEEGNSQVLYVTGSNFTPYSIVYINGKPRPTTQLSKKALSVSDYSLKDTMTISVAQVGTDSEPLSFTNSIIMKANGEIISKPPYINE